MLKSKLDIIDHTQTVSRAYANIAGRVKKRKLPKDLSDASAMATSHLNTVKKIGEACQVLRSLSTTEVHSAFVSVDLSPNNAVLLLVAQYGIKDVLKVCSALSRIPEALPQSQKESVLQASTGRDLSPVA